MSAMQCRIQWLFWKFLSSLCTASTECDFKVEENLKMNFRSMKNKIDSGSADQSTKKSAQSTRHSFNGNFFSHIREIVCLLRHIKNRSNKSLMNCTWPLADIYRNNSRKAKQMNQLIICVISTSAAFAFENLENIVILENQKCYGTIRITLDWPLCWISRL